MRKEKIDFSLPTVLFCPQNEPLHILCNDAVSYNRMRRFGCRLLLYQNKGLRSCRGSKSQTGVQPPIPAQKASLSLRIAAQSSIATPTRAISKHRQGPTCINHTDTTTATWEPTMPTRATTNYPHRRTRRSTVPCCEEPALLVGAGDRPPLPCAS